MVLTSANGRWLATLHRAGGGRSGQPVEWLVYWSLLYADQPPRRFATRADAAAWVRGVERRLQRAALAPASTCAQP